MSLITLKSKIDLLNCKDFLILGCGPSLGDFSLEELSAITQNKIVIAIKQAIFKFPFSDILICNTCNFSDYSKVFNAYDWDTHSLFQVSFPEMPHYPLSCWDTILLIGQNINYNRSLAMTKDIESWSFKNSPNLRCWGPSLIFETVFYLCYYLDAKNIYTIGWDMATENGPRSHYYNENDFKIFNKARPLEPKETEMEVELSRLFYEWLKSKNINLYIASENSYAHKDIPRIKL